MKLQLAIDLHTAHEALALLDKVGNLVDVIEAGTPLVKFEGLRIVTEFKKRFPTKDILADIKTMDAGALEAQLAFEAGADLATVLAVANNDTSRGAVEVAQKMGRTIVADLIGVANKPERTRELADLGVTAVEVHAGLDEQAHGGTPFDVAVAVRQLSPKMVIAVAGGVKPSNIARLSEARADVAVVGAAIYSASYPVGVVQALRDALSVKS